MTLTSSRADMDMTELLFPKQVGVAGPPPSAPHLPICCGPGAAQQWAPFGLIKLLKGVRAQYGSKMPGKGDHTGSPVERLGRGGLAAGASPTVSWLLRKLSLCFPRVL